MWTLAQEHNALMISLEHRYYGESQPVPDMSNSNMKYLTSEQALEDVARFVSYINSQEAGMSSDDSTPALKLKASTKSSKWVAYGGSYPGSLTTWVKLKYPALFAGSVGSSAPVDALYEFVKPYVEHNLYFVLALFLYYFHFT
jgi:thymus-specific serine protease